MPETKARMLNLTQRAAKMEVVNEDVALNLYLEVFRDYEPNVISVYESAIRLLEKRDRLLEALDIVDRGIGMINEDLMSKNHKEKFLDIKKRLTRKIKSHGIKVPAPKKNNKILVSLIGIFGIVMIIIGLLVLLSPPDRNIHANTLMTTDEDEENSQEKKSDNKKSPGSSETPEDTTSDRDDWTRFQITSRIIEYTTKNIARDSAVKQVIITTDKDILNISIITHKKDMEKAKELTKKCLGYIGSAAAKEYSKLSAPRGGKLGQIFEFYKLDMTVATGAADSTVYLRPGIKAKDRTILFP